MDRYDVETMLCDARYALRQIYQHDDTLRAGDALERIAADLMVDVSLKEVQ